MRYLQSETPLKEWADILPDMVATDNIDLLILDSLGMALSGSFNDGDVVVELFQIIRRLKCTTLIIDHQAKAEGSSEQGPIGSTYKKALARSVWEIRKAEGDGFRIGLYHRKSNRGRLHKPIGFEIDVDEDPYHNITEARFSSIQVSDDENLSKGTSAADQLANVLNSGTLSLQDIYDALPDIAKATLRATLSRHRRFLKNDDGHWGLTAQT